MNTNLKESRLELELEVNRNFNYKQSDHVWIIIDVYLLNNMTSVYMHRVLTCYDRRSYDGVYDGVCGEVLTIFIRDGHGMYPNSTHLSIRGRHVVCPNSVCLLK